MTIIELAGIVERLDREAKTAMDFEVLERFARELAGKARDEASWARQGKVLAMGDATLARTVYHKS